MDLVFMGVWGKFDWPREQQQRQQYEFSGAFTSLLVNIAKNNLRIFEAQIKRKIKNS